MTGVRIIVQRPGHPELSRVFTSSPVRFGRSAQNDLPLPETYVSEWHGAIRFDGDMIELTDLGSTNGTTQDGQKLVPGAPVRLNGSTVFQIGPLTMLLEPALGQEDDPGSAKTMLPDRPRQAPVVPQPATEASQPSFNPPTLFGDRAFGAQPPASEVASPLPQGNASNDAPRARVPTQVPPESASPSATPSFNPPTLFGMSANLFKAPEAAPAPPPAVSPPSSVAAAGPVSFNPPTLFGISPKEVLAQGPGPRAPSPPPAAPGMTPKAPADLGAVKSINPPTLFGDRPVLTPPEAAPPAPQPGLLRSGAVKNAGPPTLFGVATGAVSRDAAHAPVPNSGGGGRGLPPGVIPVPVPAALPSPVAAGPAWPTPVDATPAPPQRVAPVAAPPQDDSRFHFTSPPQPQAPQPAPFVAAPAPVAQPPAQPASVAAAGAEAATGATRSISAQDRGEIKTQAVLRAFCDAFIDLRRGFEEAGAELGVRTVSGSTPLHSARDGAELLRYMTEPSADPAARAQELRTFIADFAVHQVAMMEGVNQGVRALLTALDPQEFGIEKGPKFMPILDKERWRLYTEQFSGLLETDHELNQRVFGSEFAEGYASVIYGAKGSSKSSSEEKPRRSPSKPSRRRRP